MALCHSLGRILKFRSNYDKEPFLCMVMKLLLGLWFKGVTLAIKNLLLHFTKQYKKCLDLELTPDCTIKS
jgi:hypothetical protein